MKAVWTNQGFHKKRADLYFHESPVWRTTQKPSWSGISQSRRLHGCGDENLAVQYRYIGKGGRFQAGGFYLSQKLLQFISFGWVITGYQWIGNIFFFFKIQLGAIACVEVVHFVLFRLLPCGVKIAGELPDYISIFMKQAANVVGLADQPGRQAICQTGLVIIKGVEHIVIGVDAVGVGIMGLKSVPLNE